MQPLRSLALVPALAALILGAPAEALSRCDPAAADAAALALARQEIDQSCACDLPSRSQYLSCGRTTVDDLVLAAELRPECRRDALRHVRLSRCGRAGAEVCCRLTASGRERHRIVRDASRCSAPTGGSACISDHTSVVSGCDAGGCVPPNPGCGNGVVETGEECDPPDFVTCSAECQEIVCEEAPGDCGNGTVDAGEDCEPPGTATCDRTCRAVSCGAPPAGEVTVACLGAPASLGLGSNGAGYVAAWSTRLHQPGNDVLSRPLDADGVPQAAGPTVLSGGLLCQGNHSSPAVASAGSDYAVSWSSFGGVPEIPGATLEAIHARAVGGGGSPNGATAELIFHFPVGSCRQDVIGPTAIAPAPGGTFATLYRWRASCLGDPIGEWPAGTLVPLPAGAPLVDFGLGGLAPPPGYFGGGAARVAALGYDTLAGWPVTGVLNANPPFVTVEEMSAAWIDAGGPTTPFSLGTAHWVDGVASPDVSAGDASFLAAWASGLTDLSTSATEIRGMRVSRTAGLLDPIGGLLLATSATAITRGPVVAFDGDVWLVAWIETSGPAHDLRAVAVGPDGSVVDPSPRLLAAGVSNVTPALASVGGGSLVVLLNRPAPGGATAINSLEVDGS